jgi:hypothetical protein
MFDCYHRWLAIPMDQRPPTYYQLLGIAPNETDPEVIEEAALRQTSHIRTYQTGPYAQQCQALLNELGQAKVTLLNPGKRKDYDARLGKDAVSKDRKPPSGLATGLQPVETPDLPERVEHDRHERGQSRRGVMAYLAILLLGAALAFWLSFTTP